MNEEPLAKHPIFKNFAIAGSAWAAITLALCIWYSIRSHETQALFPLLGWALGLCALCMSGLYSLGKLLAALLSWMAEPQKQVSTLIRASYWATLKLASLLLLNAVLLKHTGIPSLAILLGVGTLGVVPLFGGICWSQRTFRHA